MGGWCRYKIAQLSGRPSPPARSGRRRPFPRSAVPRSRRGTGPVAPGPQGAQRQLPASSPEPAAPSGGAGRTEVRAALGSGRRAAPGPVSPAGPARRREPGLHRQLEDVVRWRSGSEAGAPERRALSPRAPEEAPSGLWARPGKGMLPRAGVERQGHHRGRRPRLQNAGLHTGFESWCGG